ncbi:MAG: A/G-specific adenine glycosylase [Nanoarchaeota archaeon]|nr:A/G-specific adenine glycosylase [Nanoarchaeota archaeon]
MTLPVERVQRMLLGWYAKNMRVLPWRQTTDPYHILVSEMMLQQTQVSRVIPKYEAFLNTFPTVERLAAARPGAVIVAWKGLGYNRRAINLHKAAQAIRDTYNGEFPHKPEQLRTLPGIGEYTSSAVATFAYNHPVAVVDTNVRRIIQRVMGWPTPIEELIALQAQQLLPKEARRWNNAIMDFGAMICTDKPSCSLCPIVEHCRYEKLPAAEQQHFTYAVRKQGTFKGSDRYFRGRIIDLLRSNGELTTNQLKKMLTRFGTPQKPMAALLSDLEQDGLVKRVGTTIMLP